jgi:hypothetical protein
MLDRDLLSELQLTLIEPPDGGDTWPSLIWDRVEVLDALNAGVRQLARAVHLDVARIEIPVATPGTVILALPADWLATAALVWRDTATAVRTPLGPADSFEADLAAPGWETTPGLPLAYADLDADPLTLRLIPPPAAPGVVELLYIRVPPTVAALAPGEPLPLAEEFTAAVKYAALGSLLRKVGRLLDPERADYADRRVELSRVAAEIILHGWS